MRTDKAAWTGSMVFALVLAFALVGPTVDHAFISSEGPAWARPLVHRDLDRIAEDTMRVLVMRDPLTWEEHPGAVSGLEWELLERFAKKQRLRIRAVPVDHPDSMLLMLQRGEGDVMAAQLSPMGWAAPFVAFTASYRSVAPLRAVLNTDGVPRPRVRERHVPGAADTLHISRWSPFVGPHTPLDTAYGPITLITDSALPEDLLVGVSLGLHRSAIIVDAISAMDARRFPHLHFGPRLGRSVPLAFGVRSNAPHLRMALDAWMADTREKEARELITESYGQGRLTNGPVRMLHDLEFSADSISPFDSLFQVHADSSAFDWELLAAMGFKESRFDTSAVSHAGASGLMQIMPKTAQALGVDSADGVAGDIGGARKYLDRMDALFSASVPNKDQRLKFVLAAYNAGAGHVQDAQRLAAAYGLDTRRWDGSVERALLLLAKPRWFLRADVKHGYCRAHETFWYVRDVVSAFGQYRRK